MIPPLIPKNAPIKSHVEGNYRFQLIAFVIQQLLVKIAPDSDWLTKLLELFEKNENVQGIGMGFKADWRSDVIWGR